MKYSWITSVCYAAVLCSGHPLDNLKRQFDPNNPLVQAIGQTSFKKEFSNSTFPHQNAKKVTLWYGPYKIHPAGSLIDLSQESPMTAFSLDPSGTGWNALASDFPRDVTLLHASASIVLDTAMQSKADISSGVYLHHLLFFDLVKPAVAAVGCSATDTSANGTTSSGSDGADGPSPPPHALPFSQWPVSMFMAGSEDVGAAVFADASRRVNAGYYIGGRDSIAMMGDVVNLSNETRHVFARAELEYVEGRPEGLLETSVQMVSVGQCDGRVGIFGAPQDGSKQFAVGGSPMEVAADGWLLTSKGHLHDGGKDVVVKINGNETCISKAEYGGPGAVRKGKDGNVWETIRTMTYCDGPVRVKQGDKIELEARYDLDAHPARKQMDGGMAEEMALMTFFIAQDNPTVNDSPVGLGTDQSAIVV